MILLNEYYSFFSNRYLFFLSFLLAWNLTSCNASQLPQEKKIHLDPSRFYQMTHAESTIEELFDGSTSSLIRPLKNSIVENIEVYYPLLEGESILIEQIKMFDGIGSLKQPFKIYVIDSTWRRIKIAEFYGYHFNKWVGPNPLISNSFNVDTIFSNIRYIVFCKSDGTPTEIEFYGKYTSKKLNTVSYSQKSKLKSFFGINAFEWDFIDDKEDRNSIDSNRIKAISSLGGIRHYLDWERIEEKEGSFTFNPCHNGGWNYDAMYSEINEHQLDLLVCLKTIPKWMLESYPPELRDNENIPARFGKNLSEPFAYIEQAKAAFQFAARYGKNKNIDPRLLKVNTSSRWVNDRINQKKVGLDLVQYIECDNERDKWWKGRKAYQTGREYAANLSAFYDGHKQTLGKDVGVKSADTSMKVVMAGLADPTSDFVKGMIDWCKEYRGFRKDGTVDICWDVINFHYYTNEVSIKRGVPPEFMSNGKYAASLAASFLELSSLVGRTVPVWVTEAGYDHHPESPNKAVSIGAKNPFETQADWILRTSLLYSRAGVEKVFFYQLKDDNSNYGGIYSTSGFLNSDFTNRPVVDFIFQIKKLFGEFIFEKNIIQSPIVDHYRGPDNQDLYIAYIPDEKGRKEYIDLKLPGVSSVSIFTPVPGAKSMHLQVVKVSNNKLIIPISETPTFVLVR